MRGDVTERGSTWCGYISHGAAFVGTVLDERQRTVRDYPVRQR